MPWVLLSALLAVAPSVPEGDAQAYTSLFDARTGAVIADGRYAQWVKDDVLHIDARYDFPDGRTVVEQAAIRLHPRLTQESWDWTEKKGDRLIREYQVDFRTRKAIATRVDQQKRWKEDLDDIEPGKTFAGIAFATAIKALRSQLAPGQHVELRAIAFTPRPRSAPIILTRDGVSPVQMAGREVKGDRYTIHVDIPGIVRLFIDPPDIHIWLVAGEPPAFLRFEGPLVEPKDPTVRIDLIPGPLPEGFTRRAEARPK